MLDNTEKSNIIRGSGMLTDSDIQSINAALGTKQRVEIIRTADGIKIYTVKRKEINNKP